jgi:hypothetical protein
VNKERNPREERLELALARILQWSEAYPLEVFPEPDLEKAHEVLQAAGMGLDAISASAIRHVIKGIGKIAWEALHGPCAPEMPYPDAGKRYDSRGQAIDVTDAAP